MTAETRQNLLKTTQHMNHLIIKRSKELLFVTLKEKNPHFSSRGESEAALFPATFKKQAKNSNGDPEMCLV